MTHPLTDKKKKITFYLFLFLFLSTIFNFKIVNYLRDIFKIKNIEINDQFYLKEFDNLIDKNIFNIKKDDVLNTILKLQILENFQIKKIYPNKIAVIVKETKPIAKIYIDNDIFYIGENKSFFKSNINLDEILLVTGTTNKKIIISFLQNIKKSNINYSSIKKIIYFSSKRWDIVFKDKTILKLPSSSVSEKMKIAKILIDKEEFRGKVIDLRINNRVILANE